MREARVSSDSARGRLRAAAVIAILLGAALTLQSLLGLPATAQRLRRKTTDLATLQTLQQTAARQQAVLAAWEQNASRTPPPLSDLWKPFFPEQAVTVHELDAEPTMAGWSVRRVSATVADVRLDSVGEFLHVVATQQPPWSLAECTIQASVQTGYAARVELILESAERAASGK
jgi:hypothetical protein